MNSWSGTYSFPTSIYMEELERSNTKKTIQCEPIDCETVKFQREKHNSNELSEGILKYLLCFFIGISVACLYLIYSFSVEKLIELRHKYLEKAFESENSNGGLIWATIAGTSLLGALIGGVLVFMQPSAAGSGMPEVLTYLNGVKVKTYIKWKTLLFKFISLILAVAAGLVTSDDGPFAHIGTILAVLYTKLFLKFKVLPGYFETGRKAIDTLLNKENKMLYGISGAGAGFAAVFRAPLGGVAFVFEEAMSHFDSGLILRTLFVAYSSYVLAGVVDVTIHKKRFLSPETFSLYAKEDDCTIPLNYYDFLTYLLLGIGCGIMGHINNVLYMGILKIRLRYLVGRPYFRFMELCVVTLLTVSVMVLLPGYGDKCIPLSNLVSHIESRSPMCMTKCGVSMSAYLREQPECYKTISLPTAIKAKYFERIGNTFMIAEQQCRLNPLFTAPLINTTGLIEDYQWPDRLIVNKEKKCYYPLRSLFWAVPEDTMRNIFSRGLYNFLPAESAAIFGVSHYALALLTYNIMLPTDTVFSNMALGGCLGRLYGLLLNIIRARLGLLKIDPGVYAILGAMTLWAGASRLMFAVILICIESTADLNLLPAIVISVLAAVIVGNFLGDGLYHQEIELRSLPLLPMKSSRSMRSREVGEIIRRDFIALPEKITHNKALELLKLERSDFNESFMVVSSLTKEGANGDDENDVSTTATYQKLLGVVTRAQLKAIVDMDESNITSDIKDAPTEEDKGDNDDQDKKKDINLSEIMNNPPHSVNYRMNLSKVYQMFRQLKLKQLAVEDDAGYLIGMITREEIVKALDR